MSTVKFIPPEGNIETARIILIGEAPGEKEEYRNKPFCGRSGYLLRSILDELNLLKDDLYITNVVKVRPPNNRTPTEEELNSWIPFLYDELKKGLYLKDVPVVTLGACATKALLKKNYTSISKMRGNLYIKNLDTFQKKIIPTFHPAYIIRNYNKFSLFRDDLILAKEVINEYS